MTKKSLLCIFACLLCGVFSANAQDKMAAQIRSGLALQPTQQGQVEFSTPAAEDVEKCKIERINKGAIRIIDANGLTLREFLDTNEDGAIDQWRYFRDGIEVYRDIDQNGNKKADNCRWYNTAGTRWGIDEDEDGKLDSWKVLSPQELTAEIIAALATGDEARFTRVLLTAQELKDLGLGEEKHKLIVEKLRTAQEKFKTIAATKPLDAKAVWVQFSGSRPSTFSEGTEGSTADVDYYENATCVANSADKDVEIAVGTLLRAGKVWKAIDCPQIVTQENVNELVANNVFIRVTPAAAAAAPSGAHPSMEALDKLDAQIAAAGSTQEMATLHAQRADMLEGIAAKATGEDRVLWIRNLADGIMGAVQQNVFPEGLERLQKLFDTLDKDEADKSLAAYVKFRLMSAEYSQAMTNRSVPWMQARTKWLENLTKFTEDYPDAPDTAEALLQLAMENENDGMDDKALASYSKIVEKFPESPSAAKARGAIVRLNSVGKPISLVAPIFGMEGKQANTESLKGKAIVVLHFWATWMDGAAQEMDKLKELRSKYPKDVIVFGVNLDNNPDDVKKFVDDNKVSWYQFYEKGGMDSRPANAFGIFNVPTVIVIGKDGNVISRNALVNELDGLVKKALGK